MVRCGRRTVGEAWRFGRRLTHSLIKRKRSNRTTMSEAYNTNLHMEVFYPLLIPGYRLNVLAYWLPTAIANNYYARVVSKGGVV
jgi:hypothetical protein